MLVYLPALGNGFVNWDDDTYVYENVFIQTFDGRLLRAAFLEFHVANWHPLTWLSHALDVRLWGLEPWGHHLTNVLLHGLNGALVVAVCLGAVTLAGSRLPQGVGPTERQILMASAATGLLFGVHPSHVESVVWISERKDVLCGVFFLASILAYLGHLKRVAESHSTPGWPPRSGPYRLSLFLFALALLSKPMAASLPLVLIILDWSSGAYGDDTRPSGRLARSLVAKVPFLLLSAASAVVTVLAQRSGGSMVPLTSLALQDRLITATTSLIGYLRLLIWPADLYAFRPFVTDRSPMEAEFLASALAVVAISVLTARWAKTNRAPLACWLYFVVTLLPVLGIVQVGSQAMADRYLYLPSIGPFLLIALAGVSFFRSPFQKTVAGLVATGALLGLCYLTLSQIRVWKDGVSLWSHVLDHAPAASTPYQQLGNALFARGRIRDGCALYQQALQFAPGDWKLLNNAAICELEFGDVAAARRHALSALTAKPDDGNALNTMGEIEFKEGDFAAANRYFRHSVRQDPSVPARNFNLALSFEKLGDLTSACRYWMRYLKVETDRSGISDVKAHMREIGCSESMAP